MWHVILQKWFIMREQRRISSFHYFNPTHPSWHNHRNGLDQTLQGDELVEAVHLASSHIQPVFWHHTCRQEQNAWGDKPFWQHEIPSQNSWLIGVTSTWEKYQTCCKMTQVSTAKFFWLFFPLQWISSFQPCNTTFKWINPPIPFLNTANEVVRICLSYFAGQQMTYRVLSVGPGTWTPLGIVRTVSQW